MTKILYVADPSNGKPERGVTLKLDSGEPCTISSARAGVRVKKSRFGTFFGPYIYNESNLSEVAVKAELLTRRFSDNLVPPGITDPVLHAFVNAIAHCASCAEVAIALNGTDIKSADDRLQRRADEIDMGIYSTSDEG